MRKLLTFTLFVLLSALTVLAQQPDSVITEFLSASVITEGNITYKVDRMAEALRGIFLPPRIFLLSCESRCREQYEGWRRWILHIRFLPDTAVLL